MRRPRKPLTRIARHPAFMFHEGYDPTAAAVFGEIARLTHGVYARFDAGAARQLRDLLTAAAIYATGGGLALRIMGIGWAAKCCVCPAGWARNRWRRYCSALLCLCLFLALLRAFAFADPKLLIKSLRYAGAAIFGVLPSSSP